MQISIVIPVYKCSNFLNELYRRLESSLEKITEEYEIIFVNDQSPENDWEIIKNLASNNKKIKGINLSRNFGQHYAITAGLSVAIGEWIVVMDGDLQDQPEEIEKLFYETNKGFDIVYAQRKVRKDGYLKKLGSAAFYRLFSYLTETKQDETIGNFGIYHKLVIQAVLGMKDNIRYFPTMTKWVGFNSNKIEVEHASRAIGKSSYNFRSLLKLAFNNIISFSDKPLRLVLKFGFFISLFAVLIAFFYLYQYLTNAITEMGYTSIILSIWFLSGIIIMILGIVGIYVGKSFEKVKERPMFIVKERLNLE